ncbi:MAG: DUF1579 family protein [Acidimicrobiia bacterium]
MADDPTPCGSDEARQFDFWLGEWDLTWPADQVGGEPSELGTGTNRIERLFGDCAIEENFATSDHGFSGRSLSVYDSRLGMWRQTWVDSSGGYIALTGQFDGETMTLSTQPHVHDGETRVNRMIFGDITAVSLEWVWQVSRDDGATWDDLWNISYRRRA